MLTERERELLDLFGYKLIGRPTEDGGLDYPSSMTEKEMWDAYSMDMLALDRKWDVADGDAPGVYLTEEDQAKRDAEIAKWAELHKDDPLPFT